MRLVFMGPPGAGKGTQAKAVAEKFDMPHISSGDIFRGEIENETPLGRQIKQYLDSGDLVPDEITVKAVMGRLDEDDCSDGWILDGFPRTEGQAKALDAALADRDETLDAVVYLAVDPEVIVERMAGRRTCPSCGRVYHMTYMPPASDETCDDCGEDLVIREDDKPETVRSRLYTYNKQTAPLVGYYREQGVLFEINGEGKPEEVRERLFGALEDVAG